MVRYMEIKMIEITDKFVYEFLEIYLSKQFHVLSKKEYQKNVIRNIYISTF